MEMHSRHRLKGQSLNRLIPNILTLLALCAGITAMRYGLQGAWERAVIAILVAAVLDGLDGRIARALGASSRFGAELDSLSDFVAFGVAPAFVIYLWSLQTAGGFGWALTLLFAVCCGLRLARFNTALESDTPQPSWTKNFFVGVPAPLGGLLALMPLILGLELEHEAFASPLVNGAVITLVAALMVSRVPTLALKQAKVPARYVVFVLLGVGAVAAFLISTPWITLSVAGVGYLISIPYASRVYRRMERTAPDADAEVEEPEDAEV
jgi:CDP-diacylglycerol--serine O-phosphatidyltransferase